MPPVDSGPAIPTARTELADLIAESAGGLSDGERAVLELTYQHGLEGTDLAAALEVSAARARAMALRLRQTVDRSLGALLVARRIQCDPGACPELAEILDGWDGQFTSLTRKRITRHIDLRVGPSAARHTGRVALCRTRIHSSSGLGPRGDPAARPAALAGTDGAAPAHRGNGGLAAAALLITTVAPDPRTGRRRRRARDGK